MTQQFVDNQLTTLKREKNTKDGKKKKLKTEKQLFSKKKLVWSYNFFVLFSKFNLG